MKYNLFWQVYKIDGESNCYFLHFISIYILLSIFILSLYSFNMVKYCKYFLCTCCFMGELSGLKTIVHLIAVNTWLNFDF